MFRRRELLRTESLGTALAMALPEPQHSQVDCNHSKARKVGTFTRSFHVFKKMESLPEPPLKIPNTLLAEKRVVIQAAGVPSIGTMPLIVDSMCEGLG
jgi:hypothetical protein